MEKINKIIWSPSARRDVAKLLEYLHSNWTKSIANDYLKLIDRNITLIQQSPKQFPFINEIRDIHKCVISKHNSIIYMIENNTVIILRVFDTRQNPGKMYRFD